MKDISSIQISYDNNPDLDKLPMCYKYVNFINPKKNNIMEKYIIFTSKFQINLLTKYKQIMIDGTFKSCPKKFYQIINFAGYLEEINSIVPIFMIPCTGKNEFYMIQYLKILY